MSSNVYATLTQLQSNTNRLNYERGRANLGSDKLSKDAFFQLMMAQLQNQDPTEPTDNSQFLQQQAMYAQTEAMQNLTDTMTLTSQITQASSLVGKYVEVAYTENGKTDPTYVTGKVDSIIISNGNVGLNINGTTYSVNQVTKVFDGQPSTNTSNTTMSIADQIVAANRLKGKYVKFNYTQQGGTTPIAITGYVQNVNSTSQNVTLQLNDGQVYDFSDITVTQTSDTAFSS